MEQPVVLAVSTAKAPSVEEGQQWCCQIAKNTWTGCNATFGVRQLARQKVGMILYTHLLCATSSQSADTFASLVANCAAEARAVTYYADMGVQAFGGPRGQEEGGRQDAVREQHSKLLPDGRHLAHLRRHGQVRAGAREHAPRLDVRLCVALIGRAGMLFIGLQGGQAGRDRGVAGLHVAKARQAMGDCVIVLVGKKSVVLPQVHNYVFRGTQCVVLLS